MVKLCGARAKTNGHNPCRHAAMSNGRCWLHGGRSTGPKTTEGRRRMAAAHTKTGKWSKQVMLTRRQTKKLVEITRELIALARVGH